MKSNPIWFSALERMADTFGDLGIRKRLSVASVPIGLMEKRMTKLPFDYVLREVEKLYARPIPTHETAAIDKQCAFIAAFINACGWTEEEFMRADFGFAPLDNQGQSN
jgi:hypothetical protein